MSSEVSKDLIRSLRNDTAAGFALCREALIASNNDKIVAINYIRDKLCNYSENFPLKTNVLTNGLVAVGHNSNCAVLIKMNCQTDFVSKTSEFFKLISSVLECVVSSYFEPINDGYSCSKISPDQVYGINKENRPLERHIKECSGLLGEKIQIDSTYKIKFSSGYFPGIYAHSSGCTKNPDLSFPSLFGRIGSIVLVKSNECCHGVPEIARLIAQQITGINPFVDESKDFQEALKNLMAQNYLTEPHMTVEHITRRHLINISAFYREEHIN